MGKGVGVRLNERVKRDCENGVRVLGCRCEGVWLLGRKGVTALGCWGLGLACFISTVRVTAMMTLRVRMEPNVIVRVRGIW